MMKDSVFSGNVYKNVGDFSAWETPNDKLPIFFTKENNYGLTTRSRTTSQEEFIDFVKKHIKK